MEGASNEPNIGRLNLPDNTHSRQEGQKHTQQSGATAKNIDSYATNTIEAKK